MKFNIEAVDNNGEKLFISLDDDHVSTQKILGTLDDHEQRIETLEGVDYASDIVYGTNCSNGGNTNLLNHGTFVTCRLEIDYSATITVGTTIATLPASARPIVPIAVVLYDSTGGQDVMALVDTDGTVTVESALNTGGTVSGSLIF